MTTAFVWLMFMFPYSQIGLVVVAYALNVLASWQRAKNDMAPRTGVPFKGARFDWKLADTLSLLCYGVAFFTALGYLLVSASMRGI